jgi:hypothetical protein
MQQDLDKDQAKKFAEAVNADFDINAMCTQVRQIGAPDYHPAYMIEHGMEAMMENYIFRYVLENRMAPPESRKTIRLLPMPNFESTIFSSPEMKIHMYFTGTDVIKAMIKEKYLS